ncbi:MAG: iron-sulfur cluster assembly scaffold protein [Chloroflexota bacterium]
MTETRYTATTIDHFQQPRNVGRLQAADGFGRVDDASTDTMVEIYLKLRAGTVVQATFRTFGCSACIAASSMATELLIGRTAESPLSAPELDLALGGLPEDKRYCAEVVAQATGQALSSAR